MPGCRVPVDWARGCAAVVASLSAHLLVLGIAALVPDVGAREGAFDFVVYPGGEPVAVTMVASEDVPGIGPEVAALPGDPLPTVPGAADVTTGHRASPLPRADLEVPDRHAATRGGGGAGGADTWTGRHDAETLRAQSWNDPDRYQLPRRRTGDVRASEESIAQLPQAGLDQQERQAMRRARVGAEAERVPAPRGA